MTSNGVYHEEASSVPVGSFRGANGNKITLQERRTPASNTETNGVIEFGVYNDSPCEASLNLLLLCLTLLFWCTVDNPIPTIASLIALALRCHRLATSVTVDTLLVIESVGVQILGKRRCPIFNSSQFLPWNTVHDIFINEVIIGQRVLYYLTFIVKESTGSNEKVRLVPLFRELVPERKCLEYIGTKDFSYEKELMNIIRRVIKCLPCQGQQFSTRHLLVTFNHTYWTSQDKMYAMHKFRDKPVAAPSPRAFVLTIHITTSRVNINPANVKDKRSSLRLRNKNPESQDNQCASVAKTPSKSVRLNTDNTVDALHDDDDNDNDKSSNCETNTTAKSLQNDITNRKDTSTTSDVLRISQEPMSINRNMKSKDHTSKDNLPVESETKDTDVNELEDNNMDVDSNSKDFSNTTESSEQSYSDTMKEPTIESANLLPRRLTDNDNSYSSDSPLISIKSMKLDPPTETQNTPFSSNFSNHLALAEEEEDEDFELKVDSDDVPLRSADITDLVMEGVMFTIRQDRDSVTVMEQKTKLEMDEVLENSEKVENREGEKCLLNSSLLKLENLITKIEMPKSEERRQVGWTGFAHCSPATKRVDIPSKEANLPIDYGNNRRQYSTSTFFENMYIDSNESTTGISESEGSETESTDNGTDDSERKKKVEYDSTGTSDEDSMLPSITPNEREVRAAEVMQLKATRKKGDPLLRINGEFDSLNDNRTLAEEIILKTPMINNGMTLTPIPNKSFVNSQKNIDTDSTTNPDSQSSHQKPQRLIDLITANENQRLSNKTSSAPRMISSTVLTDEQIPPSLRNVIRKKSEKHEAKRGLSDEVTNTKNSEGTWENSISSTDDDLNFNNTSIPVVQRTAEDTEETMQTSPVKDKLKPTVTTPLTNCTTASREELQQIDIEALVNKISGTMRPGNVRTDVNCRKRKINSLSKRSLRQRECPMKTSRVSSSDNREFFIDMRKLVQDITRGVKVVVKRIPITDKTVYAKCIPERKS